MTSKSCSDPLVTIVIPVYNGENYIRFALDSALSQTYANLEILVIDDGSTDSTKEICKSYGDKIRYIRKKNGGVSSALNLALRKMKGTYFSWLSHDDTYEPNKVSCEVDYLRSHNQLNQKVIVFSDYYLINSKGKIISKCKKPHEEIARKPEYSLLKGHVNGLSLLIPKKAFDECGDFDEKMVCAQDYEMWRRFMNAGYAFEHIQELLVSTRYHSKQVTNTNPRVETEGNKFYIETIEQISDSRAEELEGSRRNLYLEFADFYKFSAYSGFSEYCDSKAKAILDEWNGKTDDILASVIIPFYNRLEKLTRSIQSVLNQTHKKIELLLVNDCSTEDYSKALAEFRDDKRIKVIDMEKNSGPSAARNVGILKARGEYVAFLDSDDEFTPDKIRKSLVHAKSSKANILYTAYERHDEETGKRNVIGIDKMYGHCEKEMIYSCRIATPTVLLRREWILDNKLLFDEKIKIGEDTILWLKCMKNNTYLTAIDEPLTIVNTNSSSAAYNIDDQICGIRNILRFLFEDDYYFGFHYEISRLAGVFAELEARNYEAPEEIVHGGIIKKAIFFAKNEGLRSLAARTKKKLVSALKHN